MRTKARADRRLAILSGAIILVAVNFASGEAFNFQNVPLDTAIEDLARMTGRNFMLSPRLTDGIGADGKVIQKPTVNFHGAAAPEQELAAILKEHGLAMIDDPATTVARIASTNEPAKKADASLLVGDTNAPLPMVAASGAPLGETLKSIANAGKIEVVIDSNLSDSDWTADKKFIVPPTVFSIRWEKITARQALLALCLNYDLTVTKDETNGVWHIELKK
jgi:hypothetical protein